MNKKPQIYKAQGKYTYFTCFGMLWRMDNYTLKRVLLDLDSRQWELSTSGDEFFYGMRPYTLEEVRIKINGNIPDE